MVQTISCIVALTQQINFRELGYIDWLCYTKNNYQADFSYVKHP
mgnify:CR=1 FL=1